MIDPKDEDRSPVIGPLSPASKQTPVSRHCDGGLLLCLDLSSQLTRAAFFSLPATALSCLNRNSLSLNIDCLQLFKLSLCTLKALRFNTYRLQLFELNLCTLKDLTLNNGTHDQV